MAKPLEDLNENRLTKFEFALLLTKIMEVLLLLIQKSMSLMSLSLTHTHTLSLSLFLFWMIDEREPCTIHPLGCSAGVPHS